MERLTEKRNGENVIPLRSVVLGLNFSNWRIEKKNPLEQFLSGDAADRLAAYEATGLTPEEVERLKNDKMTVVDLALDGNSDDVRHLRELLTAKQEGRLQILPCKVGDEVWGIRSYQGIKHPQLGRVSEMYYTKDMQLHVSVKHICRGTWGKSVFSTYEEAEAALAADKNVGHTGGEDK